MFKKVLILSASVGAGHLRAADALEKAFKKQGAAEEVKNIDVLNYTNSHALNFSHPNASFEIVRQLASF
ncbi:MAG: hypothetical protein M3Q33_12745 [Acidobacteriota bacterium]|nr:hypothetical protein [Acidobacteriota bacterium]